jgi:hypothetical protein
MENARKESPSKTVDRGIAFKASNRVAISAAWAHNNATNIGVVLLSSDFLLPKKMP